MTEHRLVSRFFLALGLLLLGAHLYVALAPAHNLLNWFPTDDAFFYFKVAQNIAAGNGSTFDGLGLTNGYHPLWLLLCVPIFWLAQYDLYLPLRLVVLVLGLLQFGSAWLVFRWLRHSLHLTTALLASLLWAVFPYIHTLTARNGLETGLSAFFLLALLATAARPQPSRWRAGALATLALLSRLDNIFFLGLLGLWLALPSDQRRERLFRWLLILPASLLAAYFWRLGATAFYESTRTVQVTLALALLIKIPLFLPLRSRRLLLAANALGSLLLGSGLALAFSAGLLPMWSRSVLLIDWAASSIGLYLGERWSGQEAARAFRWNDLRSSARRAVPYFTPLLLTLTAYLGFNQWAFGAPMPISGQIKAWWGTLYTVYGRLPASLAQLFGLQMASRRDPFYLLRALLPFDLSGPLLLGVLAAALFFLYRQKGETLRRLLFWPLLVGSAFHIWAYTARPYAGIRAWYWVAEMLLALLILALLWDGLWRGTAWQTAPAILLSFLLAAAFVRSVDGRITYRPEYINQDFFTPLDFLVQHTEKGATIGITGGGYLGYLLPDRTIVNLDGLINSTEYAALLRSGEADRYLNQIGLDYVFGREKMLTATEPYQYFLPGHLQPLETLNKNTLYRYQP